MKTFVVAIVVVVGLAAVPAFAQTKAVTGETHAPSITFAGPNNWKYSTRVQDLDALKRVKVGDKVDITWTEALILSLEEGK